MKKSELKKLIRECLEESKSNLFENEISDMAAYAKAVGTIESKMKAIAGKLKDVDANSVSDEEWISIAKKSFDPIVKYAAGLKLPQDGMAHSLAGAVVMTIVGNAFVEKDIAPEIAVKKLGWGKYTQ
jgi:hypothetical protein